MMIKTSSADLRHFTHRETIPELLYRYQNVNLRLKLDGSGTKTSTFADFVGSW